MLNCKLVEQGYAYKYVFEPNTRYAESIASLQEAAKMSKAGLWNDNVFVDIAESKER
jgi:endonuclease YncB( thermonuclease family)